MFKLDINFQVVNDIKDMGIGDILKYMAALESSRDGKLKEKYLLSNISMPYIKVKNIPITTTTNVDSPNNEQY